jgi:hypothetical protein
MDEEDEPVTGSLSSSLNKADVKHQK